MDLSIVIPVYRSQNTIVGLCRRIVETIVPMNISFEIIFIEDCGGDDSWDRIQELVNKYPNVRGIRLSRNYGQHNALLCGIRAANGKKIVTCDDDLQNPPEEIPKLLREINENDKVDVVYGTPLNASHGILRNIASHITKLTLASAMGAKTAQQISSFRAFRTDLRESFGDYRGPTVNIDVLLTWGTSRFTAVKVRHDERVGSKSGYSLRKLFHHAMNMMTGFTTLPLKFASFAGFFFAFWGLLLLLYILIRYLIEGNPVPGFPFLASVVVIFSSVQLIALGIFGEYLARVHFRSMECPSYIVGEHVNNGNKKMRTK